MTYVFRRGSVGDRKKILLTAIAATTMMLLANGAQADARTVMFVKSARRTALSAHCVQRAHHWMTSSSMAKFLLLDSTIAFATRQSGKRMTCKAALSAIGLID